jgi:hypothetical protein
VELGSGPSFLFSWSFCSHSSVSIFDSILFEWAISFFCPDVQQGPRLTQGTGRRSSNENTGSRLAPRPSLPDIAEAPTSLQKLLESEERWSFDVILLEEISEKR